MAFSAYAPLEVGTVHEINSEPDLGLVCGSLCFCIEEGTPLHRLLRPPRYGPPLLLCRKSSVAPGWPQVRFVNVKKTSVTTGFSQSARLAPWQDFFWGLSIAYGGI
jgi:hypothetical protein